MGNKTLTLHLLGIGALSITYAVAPVAVFGQSAPPPANAPAPPNTAAASTPAPPPRASRIPTPALPSLMFTDLQVKQVVRAVAAHDAQAAIAASGGQAAGGQDVSIDDSGTIRTMIPNVYVSAVLDLGDGRWTVWANGMRITPTHQSPQFTVAAVSGDSVEIVVPGDSGGRFHLRPYQTWVSQNKGVVDGIVP